MDRNTLQRLSLTKRLNSEQHFTPTTPIESACTNAKKGKLVFLVYDTEKNLLFTNENFNYSPYWDFRFTSTVTCIIQVDVKNSQFTPG
jgi:hypothetical protein